MHPEGIDVSDNNGAFDWGEWKSHISFAAVKATEGHFLQDPRFEANWKSLASIGKIRIAYHFAHPDETEPVDQANFFINTVKQYESHSSDILALDLEADFGSMKPVDVSFWAYVFMTTLNKEMPAYRTLVYCDDAAIEAGYTAKLGDWKLWVAQWGVPAPRMPLGPWRKATFWQYSATVTDRDRFLSNEANLLRFANERGK